MRVALVIGTYDALGGGAERWTDAFARRLVGRGHEVHLLARRFRGAPDAAHLHPVEVPRTTSRPRLRFGEAAGRRLDAIRPDVAHDMGDGWQADLFMPHHGTRRGTLKHNVRSLPPLLQRIRRFANKWVPRYREFRALERRQYGVSGDRLFLAVSGMIRDHMRLYCHVPEDRIRVVHNGVDVERFRPPDAARRRQVRRELGLDDEVLLLTVAHNFKLKGVDTLLRALARPAAAERRLRAIVVGGGAVARYAATARSLGCAERVRFVGDQPDPTPYYHAADVFVLPTWYDPCSLVVLEALASGLPVITTRYNGVHELMTPDREGTVLDDPADDVALERALVAWADPERRRATGPASRGLAEAHSAERMFEAHLAIYDEIVERRTAAAGPAPAPG